MVGKYTGLSDSYLSVLKVTLCFYIFATDTVLNKMCKYVGLTFFLPFCQALLHASVTLNRKLVVD